MKLFNWVRKRVFHEQLTMSDSMTAVLVDSKGKLKEVRDKSDSHELESSYKGNEIHEKITVQGKKGASRMKVSESAVTNRFIHVLNSSGSANFALSQSQPPQNDPVDAIIENKTTREVLQIQICNSDGEPWGKLVKGQIVERSGDRFEIHHKALKTAIQKKSDKYPAATKKDLVLVLDGWLGVRQEDLDEFKNTESSFLGSAGFKEIWFIGQSVNDKLFP